MVFSACRKRFSLILGELTITDSVRILAAGADQLTIDAQGNSRVFLVDDGNVAIPSPSCWRDDHLGWNGGRGGRHPEPRVVSLENSVLANNSAESGGGIAHYHGRSMLTKAR